VTRESFLMIALQEEAAGTELRTGRNIKRGRRKGLKQQAPTPGGRESLAEIPRNGGVGESNGKVYGKWPSKSFAPPK